MPPDHGRRFAKLLPRARLVEITDSYTLIPEDQPGQLAAHIRAFIASEPITATEARPIAPQP
jgi:pimeloyl-ACP methyl ester carboxylesterase